MEGEEGGEQRRAQGRGMIRRGAWGRRGSRVGVLDHKHLAGQVTQRRADHGLPAEVPAVRRGGGFRLVGPPAPSARLSLFCCTPSPFRRRLNSDGEGMSAY